MTSTLMACPDCDRPISRTAVSCPSCGRAFSLRPRISSSLVEAAALAFLCLFLVPLAAGLLGIAVGEIPRVLELLGRLL